MPIIPFSDNSKRTIALPLSLSYQNSCFLLLCLLCRGFARCLLLMVHLIHMLDQSKNLVGITPFIVIPCNNLDEGIRQGDTGLGIKDGSMR